MTVCTVTALPLWAFFDSSFAFPAFFLFPPSLYLLHSSLIIFRPLLFRLSIPLGLTCMCFGTETLTHGLDTFLAFTCCLSPPFTTSSPPNMACAFCGMLHVWHVRQGQGDWWPSFFFSVHLSGKWRTDMHGPDTRTPLNFPFPTPAPFSCLPT